MISVNFIYFGIFLTEIANVSYIIDTIKGEIRPNRVSFFLWGLAPMIVFIGQLKQGVGIQSLLAFTIGFNPLLIFAATFINKKSVWKLKKFDYVCGFLSALGLILLILTKNGNSAIIFGILADALAGLPTIKKCYEDPKSDLVWPYLTPVVTAIFTLFTISKLNFANSSFSFYIVFMNIVISSFIILDFKKLLKVKV